MNKKSERKDKTGKGFNKKARLLLPTDNFGVWGQQNLKISTTSINKTAPHERRAIMRYQKAKPNENE